MSQPAGETLELRRYLGLTSVVMVVVGSVIGSGIFMKPLNVSQALPTPLIVYATWIFLGLVVLFGAFAYGELGAMFPEAGGMYAFLREGWGRGVAFLYGWCLLLVINTGTMAALAVAFTRFSNRLVPMSEIAQIAVAAGMILTLALTNHFGVKWGAILQNTATFAKLGALGILVAAGFFLTRTAAAVPTPIPTEPSVSLLSGLVMAAVAIFWAYEGWYQVTFNAAELRDPARDLPRGLVLGIVILIVTYVLVNAVYFHLVPIDEMRTFAADEQVPLTAVQRMFGSGAGVMLSLLICLSVFGAANPSLLSSPRAFYAMARDGLSFRPMMKVHSRWRTPYVAIWAQALWAIVLVVVLKTFKDITEYVVFASLIFYGLTVAAVYRLRRMDPERPRPFRCPGYPVTPAVFILTVLFVDAYVLLDPVQRRNAVIGLLIILAGLPVYLLMTRKGKESGPT